jgi:hypothetical protein
MVLGCFVQTGFDTKHTALTPPKDEALSEWQFFGISTAVLSKAKTP